MTRRKNLAEQTSIKSLSDDYFNAIQESSKHRGIMPTE